MQISFAVTAKLISAFVFTTWIVQSLYYLHPKISSLEPSSVAVQPGLFGTWSETPKTGFLITWLNSLLQIIPHRPEKFEGQLDFGTMGVRENRSILFTLLNDNPIEVCITVKFLNFRTPENFAVICLKFKQRGKTLGYLVKKMQMEKQTVKTLIRLLL